MAKVTIRGRLGKMPQIRDSKYGKYAYVQLAENSKLKDGTDVTTWHEFVLSGDACEKLNEKMVSMMLEAECTISYKEVEIDGYKKQLAQFNSKSFKLIF